MKELSIPTSKFKFDKFTESILVFLSDVIDKKYHPSYVVMKMNNIDDKPKFGPVKGRANFQDELKSGKLLFFPFTSTNTVDFPIVCADGSNQELDDDSDFAMGDVDSVGYLFQLKDGKYIINSAIHAGGGPMMPSVDITDCDIFESPMKKYIKKFIAK